jgi:hypothetical protein
VIGVVSIKFDTGVSSGQPVAAMPNVGEPDIKVSVVAKNGGQVLVASGRPGHGQAIDLPSHNGAESGARAVLKVVDNDLADGHALSPGTANFTFGADFKLDATSASTAFDDGNNLIQRGLKGSSAQYKIQIDGTAAGPRPSCNIEQKVSAAETRIALVVSKAVVEVNRWYRVRCNRQGALLNLVVTPYNADGTAQLAVTTTTSNIPVINLTWAVSAPVVPMSIGGKLLADGTIASQSDQFNGLIDNAVLTVVQSYK